VTPKTTGGTDSASPGGPGCATPAGTYWDKTIGVETIGGVPYRMYRERPRRIEHLLAFAELWGSRPHVIQAGRVLDFENLRRASAAKAEMLLGRGLGAGDRVLLLGWNSPEWVVNFWGCLQIGAVPVLGNAWWSAEEIEHSIGD
jgi:acyl-CoA synthetase (AMP-forming)/AMP-acid ligase II